jgi:predicted metalloprotease with PDZ domain
MLRYEVNLGGAGRHLVDVTLRFPAPEGDVELTLPAWSPGSYLIRDYARHVRDLVVTGDDGAPRQVRKRDKATWAIATSGARELTVRYQIYGHELSPRTSHVDQTHAYLHPPATFLAPAHLHEVPIEISIGAPATWPIVSALGDGPTLRAADRDELYDSPIHVGPVRIHAVTPRVRLAIWGERTPGGRYDEARLISDLARVVDDQAARWGAVPYDHYTFLLMLAHDAYGGLEHRASSVNVFHASFAHTRKHYENLLELLAHEHFHTWNGTRIAPAPLARIDYAREAYTPCLWAVEGLTSHYDRYSLRAARCITSKSFLDKLLDDWARLQLTPGRRRASLEAASFDAWIKLYRPDESNLNTNVSYYLKGGVAMCVLDLEIRRRTDDARGLDDVLRALWRHHGASVPYPDDLQPSFEEATGLSLQDFFDRVIRGTEDPDLPGELAALGLTLAARHDPPGDRAAVWLGAVTSGIKVTSVHDGGPAQAAGLSPGDEVVAIDRCRATSGDDLRGLVGARSPGERVTLSVFRRHRLIDIPVVIAAAPPNRYEITAVARPEPAAAARYERWLGEPHPGDQTLASVTTTSRWV